MRHINLDFNPYSVGDRVRFLHNSVISTDQRGSFGTVSAVAGAYVFIEADEEWPTVGPGGYPAGPTRMLRAHYMGGAPHVDPDAGDCFWVSSANMGGRRFESGRDGPLPEPPLPKAEPVEEKEKKKTVSKGGKR